MSQEPEKPTEETQVESDRLASESPKSATAPLGQEADQPVSLHSANHLEKAKENKEPQTKEEKRIADNADGLRGEADPFAEPDKPTLETVIDKVTMQLHDDFLGRGVLHEEEELSTSPIFETSPRLDLIRKDGTIYVGLIEWMRQSKPGDRPQHHLLYGEHLRYVGQWHSVPTLPRALYESLILPTTLTDYKTTRDLFEGIREVFQENLTLFRDQCELLAYWCIASWFPETLSFFPPLTITGPSFAADVLFQLLRYVCRRPVLVAGMNSAVLKAIPIKELMPTLLIRDARLSNRTAELLDASSRRDYMVARGKDLLQAYCAKCIYLGEEYKRHAMMPDGIHVHVRDGRSPDRILEWRPELKVRDFQNKLLYYRCLNYSQVAGRVFQADGLTAELRAVATQLGNAIVHDDDLEVHVLDVLKEQSEQARVDRASGPKPMVLRAVLFHCHQQQVFVRDIAETVNRIYDAEGESLRASSESVGHVLKSLGLYTRRLGSGGRGLILDKSTQSLAHELSHAYEVLPDVPACGYCQTFQSQDGEEVV